ncbi:hypothetical protein [Actinophytocola sp.]|uniref:hypothetical protein n=1 Tax=Actinophytocola sp. TaxID=1872138 RepID=UPI002D8037A1|nr:hypothetical protein [Actinophytocola sp.]HET9141040.1 hypothetical protein [Actinophytocola sp.]
MGTARALVLLGSGVQLAATMVAGFVALVFAPVLLSRPETGSPVTGVAVLVVITLLDIALANLFALRATGTRGALLGGCGTLLAGMALGIAALLLITMG